MNGTGQMARGGTLRAAAAVLREAADGYRTGRITWGRDSFIGDDGCRCAVAAITWAADPTDRDSGGNPQWLHGQPRLIAQTALAVLAEHLTTQLGWPWAMEDDEPDLVETVGAWNDAQDDMEAVAVELETVAEILFPAELLGGAA